MTPNTRYQLICAADLSDEWGPPHTVGGNMFVSRGATVRGGPLRLVGAKVGSELSMSGSTFESGIFADGLVVGGGMFMVGGATVRGGPLRLVGAKVGSDLVLEGSTFESGISAGQLGVGGTMVVQGGATVRGGPLSLMGAKVNGNLDLHGSTFESGISADQLGVGGSMVVHGGATVRGGPLSLMGAKVNGNLDLHGSTFESGISANLLGVGGGMAVRGGATVHGGPLLLVGAKVGSDLVLEGSTFDAGVSAASVAVGGNMFVRRGTTVRGEPLQLHGAMVGGDFDAGDSTFESPFIVQRATVGSVFLSRSRFDHSPDFGTARVALNFDISGSRLPGLFLSGATIGGEFRLSTISQPATVWASDATLDLRNLRVGALADRFDGNLAQDAGCPTGGRLQPTAWPCKVLLAGLSYDRLGGLGSDPMLERDVGYFIALLARTPDFSRQPYQYLAGVFRTAGDSDRADAVLYAARERERLQDWGKCLPDFGFGTSECRSAVGGYLLKITIGYGLGSGYWLTLLWVLGVTGFGIVVLYFSSAAREKGVFWCFGASLDHLLPIIELNPEFGAFFNDSNRDRLKGWQIAYFGGHAIAGYVLAAFVAAGLAGLTQAQ